MGNSTSTHAPNPSKEPPQAREKDPSPHKSLRTKKKSLELPDLASLSISSSASPYYYVPHRQPTPPRSACIPIPQSNNPNSLKPGQQRERPQNNFSSTDVLVTEPSTHLPFPPPTRGTANIALSTTANGTAHNPYFKGGMSTRGQGSTGSQRYHHQKTGHQRLQELYNQSNEVPAPPPSSLDSHPRSSRHRDFVQEVVQSSIPIGLLKGLPNTDDPDGLSPKVSYDGNELVPIKITWRGGGNSVQLARAGDNDWKGRQPMDRESPSSQVYSTTVALPRGTHHFRFLVDDQWRVAEDLPTAVDDQGTLANYVAVPLSYTPPTSSTPALPPQSQRRVPGQSFWSAASSADGDIPDRPSSSRQPHPYGHHFAQWTSEIPPELIAAAREEDEYLQASSGQYESNQKGGTTYVSGFVPAPNIPPAPGLPRHLDKLILNTRLSPAPGSSSSGKNGSSGKGKGKDREKGDRERRHREGKDRDRRMPPPPPPPSEDGSGTGLTDPISSEPPSTTQLPAGTGSGTSTGEATPIPNSPDLATNAVVPSTTLINLDTPARSRPIGIDPSNTPSLSDDASVLPVPSHVVLHHLCTSAIRNNVLAVATTTRYREKYLTTVYYKPT